MPCSPAASIYYGVTSALFPGHPAASHSQAVPPTKDDPAIIPISSPRSHALSPHLHPITHSALQWICKGLRTRLPEMRQHLRDYAYDAVALQEPRMTTGSIQITGHIVHYSRPPRPRLTPRATILVRIQLTQTEVELSDLCIEVAEFVAAIELGKQSVTIVSAHVAPGHSWDTHVLEDFHARVKEELIVAGDFNAQSQSSRGKEDTPRAVPCFFAEHDPL